MYKNKHLKEVVCTYKFLPGKVDWDIAFFGQLFDKIKDHGFNQRQEKKGVTFQVSNDPKNPNMHLPKIQETELQMIFRNLEKNFAITLGKELISFHIVDNYNDWETFNKELMKPFMEKYLELDIYQSILSCQVTYLNMFQFPKADSISEYLTVVSPPFLGFGSEVNVQVTKDYLTEDNINLHVRVTPQLGVEESGNNIVMECGSIAITSEGMGVDLWQKISQDVKNPILPFFELVITEKLRETL